MKHLLKTASAIGLALLVALPAYAQGNGLTLTGGQYSPPGGDKGSLLALSQPSPAYMPPGFNWDTTNFGLSVQLQDVLGLSRATGIVLGPDGKPLTAESLFNRFSTALSAPHAVFYVAPTGGSDSNNCLSSGAACATINHAITLANTDGGADEIIVAAGIYPRASSPGGTSGVSPTHDLALVASGGPVITGTFDTTWTASADGTQTNTYSYTTANTDRVLDTTQTNQYGDYAELKHIGTDGVADASTCPAIVNRTPNSWCLYSGTQYINRADGQQPKAYGTTGGNTLVLRGGAYGITVTSEVNLYVGNGGVTSVFPPATWNIYGSGGAYQGGLHYAIASPTNSAVHVVAVSSSNFKYAGGAVGTSGRGVAIESLNGLAFIEKSDFSEAESDGANAHDANGATKTMMLTVNDSGSNNGRAPGVSNNCITNHNNSLMIDVASFCQANHGGTVRSTDYAQGWIVGTYAKGDQGDQVFGGTTPPDQISTQLNSHYWLDRVKIEGPAGSIGVNAETSTAEIDMRNVTMSAGLLVGGPGTVAGY